MTVGGGGGGNGLGLDSSSDEYEYAKFSFKWKESQQSRYHARDCLAKQPKVTADMRTKVLEWLVLVNNQFRYSLETWCLAVNLLDRFLRAQPVDPEVLQCAALAAFFVAAKLEEVDPPIISELHNVCEEAYSSAQFRCMEAIMLKKVNFELLAPTPAWFLRKICADRDHGELDSLEAYGFAKRLVEHLLCDYELSKNESPVAMAAFVYQVLDEEGFFNVTSSSSIADMCMVDKGQIEIMVKMMVEKHSEQMIGGHLFGIERCV